MKLHRSCHADESVIEQRQRFLHNTKVFIQASRVEQELRLCGMIPTIEQYWEYRTYTSAVDVTTTLTEYEFQNPIRRSVSAYES